MIYILTGPIRSGKTTSVQNWIRQNGLQCGGFISPDDGGRRVLTNLQNGKKIEFEVDPKFHSDIIHVGPFAFNKQSFIRAEQWTKEHFSNPQINLIVLDEIGKLELKDKGFHELLDWLLKKNTEKNLLIIVRSTLLSEVRKKYALPEATVLAVGDLSTIDI